jgi:tetratricopeptide (TPR) repeat protein
MVVQLKQVAGSGGKENPDRGASLQTQHTMDLIAVLDELAQIAHDRGDFTKAQALYLQAVEEGQLHAGRDSAIDAALCGVLSNVSGLFSEYDKPEEARAALDYALQLAEDNPHISKDQSAALKARAFQSELPTALRE